MPYTRLLGIFPETFVLPLPRAFYYFHFVNPFEYLCENKGREMKVHNSKSVKKSVERLSCIILVFFSQMTLSK